MSDYNELKQEIANIKSSVNDMVRNVRNILTLASNYGFAGYVDISAHDQDPNAHATNSNFVTLTEEGHQLNLGQAGEVGAAYLPNQYPISLGSNNNPASDTKTTTWQKYHINLNTWGSSVWDSAMYENLIRVFSTDNDGNKISAALARRAFYKLAVQYTTAAADPDLFGSMQILSGSTEETSDEASQMRKKISFLFSGTAGTRGLSKNFLELSHTNILPVYTNTMNLGSGQRVFANAYLNTAPTVLSDEREKTNITPVPDAVLDAWGEVGWYQYQLKQAMAEKGDNARKHNGLIAQRIDAVFKKHGLDACRLGLLCYDAWEASPEQLNEKGEVVFEAVEAGDKWSVRYEEALSMEAAYQRRRADRMEQRLAALEAKLG